MIAHIRVSDGERQTLADHARHTGHLAARALQASGLYCLGMAAGLLHDMGKATRTFAEYLIRSAAQGGKKAGATSPHAPVGAIWAYERWFRPGGDPLINLTAQLISLAVQGHHAGLYDCVDGASPCHSAYLASIRQDKAGIHYEEAVENFLREAARADELDGWFAKACKEVNAFLAAADPKLTDFCTAMLARLLLGAVADGDCWDTACFERGADALAEDCRTAWPVQKDRLGRYMQGFGADSDINRIRGRISLDCARAGQALGSGVYRLTVPTGGGKTLASLRFALEQACGPKPDTSRLLYIAPFNTILEQNASVIRKALENDPGILEHHGDIVQDDGDQESQQLHRRLTERWTSPILLTSMVQLLSTLFGPKNSQARRLPRLAGAILIFDEIQALPRKCTVLFTSAIRFLASCLRCTIVLCTATQPTLRAYSPDMRADASLLAQLPEIGIELLAGVPVLFERLRRVRFVDESQRARDNAQAAKDVSALLRAEQSVLMVVNTRRTARDIYARVAAAALPEGAVCVHLSTGMCAAHRQQELTRMSDALNRRKADPSAPPVCCVSTSLVEAGVDISFPVVIRSLAGLPSILQAAGRCNRNMEQACGTVYVWQLSEEKLNGLHQVQEGQAATRGMLEGARQQGQRLDDPELIRTYFAKTLFIRPEELFYPMEGGLKMAPLLSRNLKLCKPLAMLKDNPERHIVLKAGWRTASRAFHAIDQDTVMVLTPYREGEQVIADLSGRLSLNQEKQRMCSAQQYAVSLYQSDYQKLIQAGALYPVGETGAVALRKEFYDDNTGVR